VNTHRLAGRHLEGAGGIGGARPGSCMVLVTRKNS
jgi:hypothetical protein